MPCQKRQFALVFLRCTKFIFFVVILFLTLHIGSIHAAKMSRSELISTLKKGCMAAHLENIANPKQFCYCISVIEADNMLGKISKKLYDKKINSCISLYVFGD